MSEKFIPILRQASRKLVRELGMLQLNQEQLKKTPQHWHALIEVSRDSEITISKLAQLLLLSTSATSRIVSALIKDKFVVYREGIDKREKYLSLSDKGKSEIDIIDDFSNTRIRGALKFLKEEDQQHIIDALQKYGAALEKSRIFRESIKILTLSKSRAIRKQIVHMIESIQKKEFSIPITPEINLCVLKPEEIFYYNNSCNFWYAIDDEGSIIGTIGLKKINTEAAEIKKFFVKKQYRGRGVAQKLLTVLADAARRHNFCDLYLGTPLVLKSAHRFYEKYTFLSILKETLPQGFDVCPLDGVFFKGKVEKVRQKLIQGLE